MQNYSLQASLHRVDCDRVIASFCPCINVHMYVHTCICKNALIYVSQHSCTCAYMYNIAIMEIMDGHIANGISCPQKGINNISSCTEVVMINGT